MRQTLDKFYESVYAVTRLIPRGKVTTYGAIAEFLGSKSSSRVVGWAMNQAHKDESIPAHRVVNKQGLLTGKMHFSSPTKMEEMLLKEGIHIDQNTIIDFQAVFWDPNTSII